MKKIIMSVLFLSFASVSFARPKPKREFKILSTKRHIVYFKVDKSFIGGIVEVDDANKNCLESDEISHTHTMIYFDEAPSGHYHIKVTKDGRVIEFPYENIW